MHQFTSLTEGSGANLRTARVNAVNHAYGVRVGDDVTGAHLPLFPLDTVLVPGLVFPMHIFEPRYRELLRDVLATETQEFAVIARRPTIGPDAYPRLYEVGTTARISSVDALPDGRSDITTVGHRRFRIVDVTSTRPYLTAQLEWLEEDTVAAQEDATCRMLALRATALFLRYRGLLSSSEGDDDADLLPDDPHLLSFVLTAAPVLPTIVRQQLLEACGTQERLEHACSLLAREIEVLRVLPSVPIDVRQNDLAELT